MPTCMHCSLIVLALILLYGGHCFSVWLPSKVTHSFTHRVRLPASCNNARQHSTKFSDSIIAAKWCLPVYCNKESTERVLELLLMVYTDDLEEGRTCSIGELNIRVIEQLFLANNMTID